MKKIIKFLFILISLITLPFVISCAININTQDIQVKVLEEEKVFVVGEKIELGNYFNGSFITYVSSNEEVIKINSSVGECLKEGNVVIRGYNRLNGNIINELFVKVVKDEITGIEINASPVMIEGEKQTLTVLVTPSSSTKKVAFYSNDEHVLTISSDGELKALATGLVTITCYSVEDNSIYSECQIFVRKNNDAIKNVIEENGSTNTDTYYAITQKSLFSGIIDQVKQSIVGVKSYAKSIRSGNLILSYNASGVVYKRMYIQNNGEVVESLDKGTRFTSYLYYAIVNKHIVKGQSVVKVTSGVDEYDATVKAFDTKVDVAVITFESKNYIPVAKFADSDEVQTGEFLISIGRTYRGENEIVASIGMVSYATRYVGSDTDGDGVNDWDALYIQHDAAIDTYSTGGAIVNLKGEIIGINSVKITSDEIDNLSFAIPSNLVLNLASQLEQGKAPKRPLLGVTVITIKDIINQELEDKYKIPKGYNYGVFVNEVTYGGVAYVAGVKSGDVILEFNNIKLYYSYELRAALNEIIIDSGYEAVLKVWRDGEIIELKAVF